MEMSDSINHPPHYNTGKIEAIEAIKAALGDGFTYYLQGNVLKYLWRFRYKGKCKEDLAKAEWYVDRLIQEEAEIAKRANRRTA